MVYVVCLILLVVLLFIVFFDLVLIEGRSMFPTFKDGDLRIARILYFPKLHKFKVGGVYVFKSPYDDDRWVIKRLQKISSSGELFFVGDNPPESYDSRDYGYVSPTRVRAQVITWR